MAGRTGNRRSSPRHRPGRGRPGGGRLRAQDRGREADPPCALPPHRRGLPFQRDPGPPGRGGDRGRALQAALRSRRSRPGDGGAAEPLRAGGTRPGGDRSKKGPGGGRGGAGRRGPRGGGHLHRFHGPGDRRCAGPWPRPAGRRGPGAGGVHGVPRGLRGPPPGRRPGHGGSVGHRAGGGGGAVQSPFPVRVGPGPGGGQRTLRRRSRGGRRQGCGGRVSGGGCAWKPTVRGWGRAPRMR